MSHRAITICVALCLTALLLCAVAFVAIRQHTGAASPAVATSTDFTVHVQRGGDSAVTGATTPATMKVSGDNVDVNGLALGSSVLSFDFGTIAGSSVAANFRVSAGTATLLKWVAGILALLYIASAAFKWVVKDYVHAVGQGLAGVALFVGALDTDLLGWCFVISMTVSFFAHVFPSAAAKFRKALGDMVTKAREILPADVAAKLELDKHETTIAKAVKA